MSIGLYAKAISAAVVAALTAAVTALNDGSFTTAEGLAVAAAFLVALAGVWAVPNVPESVRVYGKAITSALVAALASIGVALTDGGVSPAEWLTVAIALLGGLGLVAIVPNAAASDNLIVFPDDEDDDEDDDQAYGPLPGDADLPPRPDGY